MLTAPHREILVIHSLFAKANFWLIDVYAIIQGERPLTEDERSQMRDWSMDSSQTSQLESELKGRVKPIISNFNICRLA